MHEFVLSGGPMKKRAEDQDARPRQAAARLRLPPADRVLPAARRRGADGRADRDRDARDARRVRRGGRGDPRARRPRTPEIARSAPYTTPVRRLDEVAAAKRPVIRQALACPMAIEHRKLGATGISVSPLCLGAMMFGAWGNTDHEDSIAIIHRRARRRHQLHRHRRRVLARRVGEDRRQGAQGRPPRLRRARDEGRTAGCTTTIPNAFGNSRRWMIKEVENSLRRLKTDWIDLYQIHRPEPDTDIDQTLGALSDLVAAGKVRAIGSSTSRPGRSSRRSGSPNGAAASASSASSRPTRC